MTTAEDILERERTPLRTHVICGIVGIKLHALGWPQHSFGFSELPCALEAIAADGVKRSVRIKSGMSKKALRALLERLEGGGVRTRRSQEAKAKAQTEAQPLADRTGGLA